MPFDNTPIETKPLTEVQRVLLGAADLIEAEGWFKCGKQPYFEHGKHDRCAIVAIGEAAWRIDVGTKFEVWRTLARLIAPEYPYDPPAGIVEWNNSPNRTKEEVVAALRAAAREA